MRPVGCEGVPDIHDGENAGGKRDQVLLQALGITAAIPSFVVTVRNFDGVVEENNRREQVIGILRMPLHD